MKFKIIESQSSAQRYQNKKLRKKYNLSNYGVHHIDDIKDNGIKTSKVIFYPLFESKTAQDIIHTAIEAGAYLGSFEKLLHYMKNATCYIIDEDGSIEPVSIEEAIIYQIDNRRK